MRVSRRSLLTSFAVLACGPVRRAFAQAAPAPAWAHDLHMRRSPDGGDSFGEATVFTATAGVPSLLCDLRGRLYCAFQWFPAGSPDFDRVAVNWSDDGGRTWTAPAPIVVSGLPADYQRPFDPTLALLPDGRIRIFFSSGPQQNGVPPGQGIGIATYSALSEDGVHYAFEPDARFGLPDKRVIDPAVVRTGDVWHYTAPIGAPREGAYHAVSRDGLAFQRAADIASVDEANWTGNLVEHGRGLRFYGGSARGLWYAESIDGFTWSTPHYLDVRGGDPGVVMTLDGTMVMVYVS